MSATEDLELQVVTTDVIGIPVAGSVKIYKGTMVSKTGGYAKKLAEGDGFAGHAIGQSDNSDGDNGDKTVSVKSGRYRLPVTMSSLTEELVGAYVYAVDEDTYTIAPTRTPVGKIVQYVSDSSAFVEFDTNISRQSMSGGLFESFKTVSPDSLTVTDVGTNVLSVVQDQDSGLLLTTDTTEDDGPSVQYKGETFRFEAGRPVVFGARIEIDSALQSDLLLGLCITDTALLGGLSDGVYFRKVDGSADLKCVVEKNSTETESASVHTLADDTAVNIGFVYNGKSSGSTIIPFINGVAQTALADTNRPDDEWLTPSIELLTGAAEARTLKVSLLDSYRI